MRFWTIYDWFFHHKKRQYVKFWPPDVMRLNNTRSEKKTAWKNMHFWQSYTGFYPFFSLIFFQFFAFGVLFFNDDVIKRSLSSITKGSTSFCLSFSEKSKSIACVHRKIWFLEKVQFTHFCHPLPAHPRKVMFEKRRISREP